VQAIGRRVPRVSEATGRIGRAPHRRLASDLWANRDQLRHAIVWATLNWLLDAACLWAFLAAFHRYVNPVELFAAYGIGNVLAVIPVTPGGLGVVEATMILLLKSFGVSYPSRSKRSSVGASSTSGCRSRSRRVLHLASAQLGAEHVGVARLWPRWRQKLVLPGPGPRREGRQR